MKQQQHDKMKNGNNKTTKTNKKVNMEKNKQQRNRKPK